MSKEERSWSLLFNKIQRSLDRHDLAILEILAKAHREPTENDLIRTDLLLDQEMDFTTAPTKCTDYDKQLFEEYDKEVSLEKNQEEVKDE